ncbi:hypothetical protein [Kordia zhangzhouensis]|uniref:hypothetical protein n=1 Tax=Kordia zhangzhouensis TaxID=1620405 RepID=UPI00062995B7|nr:hypothetical protein [Kordia zhangzhouensis]
MNDIELYKELVDFCNANKDNIETKFDREVKFTSFNEDCFNEMYLKIKNEPNPIAPKELKTRIEGLTECYKKMGFKFMRKRNKMIKGLDIQLGQWYEKAFQFYLESKGIIVAKKGFPFPDFVVNPEKPKAYYELKYIEAPFISANNMVKNTYPYTSTRYDYECSLTLDTGKKLQGQRDKYENEIKSKGVPFYFVWWFDAPHLKGIFFMNAEEVFDYWDNVGTLHNREEREGDKIANQIKGKIYPPLLKMDSLSSFLNIVS